MRVVRGVRLSRFQRAQSSCAQSGLVLVASLIQLATESCTYREASLRRGSSSESHLSGCSFTTLMRGLAQTPHGRIDSVAKRRTLAPSSPVQAVRSSGYPATSSTRLGCASFQAHSHAVKCLRISRKHGTGQHRVINGKGLGKGSACAAPGFSRRNQAQRWQRVFRLRGSRIQCGQRIHVDCFHGAPITERTINPDKNCQPKNPEPCPTQKRSGQKTVRCVWN